MSAQHARTDEPPTKRQKTGIERSPDFWFPKGDFIIVASQSVAYRIHGDVLGRKSRVFSDLLNLGDTPRPDTEDVSDGCPVVHVTDSPYDFGTFLRLIYDGFKHHQDHLQNGPHWPTTKVMVHLGDKYDVQEIREEGLRQLGLWFSKNIDAWDQRDLSFFLFELEYLDVATFTRTLNDPDLHAAVLYHCCRIPPTQLLSGIPNLKYQPLCMDDLVRVLEFQRVSPIMFNEFLNNVFGADAFQELYTCSNEGCDLDRECTESKVILYFRNYVRLYPHFEFLERWVGNRILAPILDSMCKICRARCKTAMHSLRQEYRNRLPEYFKLSD